MGEPMRNVDDGKAIGFDWNCINFYTKAVVIEQFECFLSPTTQCLSMTNLFEMWWKYDHRKGLLLSEKTESRVKMLFIEHRHCQVFIVFEGIDVVSKSHII